MARKKREREFHKLVNITFCDILYTTMGQYHIRAIFGNVTKDGIYRRRCLDGQRGKKMEEDRSESQCVF